MRLTPISPVPLAQIVDLYAATTVFKPIVCVAATLQYARSETIGWLAGDKLIAAVMLYPMAPRRPDEECREAAFICLPEFSTGLVSFVHFAQLTLRRMAKDGPLRIQARVRVGHRPGGRIASLCGFEHVATVGDHEIWEFSGD